MIHIVYASEAAEYPVLFSSMFEHRALQFQHRLNWDVNVDDNGHETDEYDQLNPLYLIVERDDGSHGGSMRFLPTTGDTMINDHFTELTGGVTIRSPFIWECTRFCLAPDADRATSHKILLGTLELGLLCGVQFYVGIFAVEMRRIYRRIGWSPTLIGEGEADGDALCAGLWHISEAEHGNVLKRGAKLKKAEELVHFAPECWSLGSVGDTRLANRGRELVRSELSNMSPANADHAKLQISSFLTH